MGEKETELLATEVELGETEVEVGEKKVKLGEKEVELNEQEVEMGEKEVELGEKEVGLNEQPTFDLGIDDLTQEEQSRNNKVDEGDNVIRDLPMLQIAEGTNVGEEKVKENTMAGESGIITVVENIVNDLSMLQPDDDNYKTPELKLVFNAEPLSYAPPIPKQDELNIKNRPERKKVLADALCSPYIQRHIEIAVKRTVSKRNTSSSLFAANGEMWDFLFVVGHYLTVIRVELETITPGIDVHVDVISICAHILNVEEKKKARESIYRMFYTAK